MVWRGGKYLCSLLILTDFLFRGTNGQRKVAELANPGYLDVRSKQLQLVWDFTVQGNDVDINCTAKYRIRGTNNTEDKNVGSTSPGVVTDLEPYTTYEFQLICVNLAGSSEPLDFPPQRTLAGKPSQPQNVRISSIQATQVFVEWDEPADKNGPIDGYVLIAHSHTFSGGGSRTSSNLPLLTPNTTYTISVKVYNFNTPEGTQYSEESPHSDSFTTLQAEVAELANPGYSNVLSKQLQLVWDFTVQGNDNDIKCTAKYRIRGTNNTEDKNVGSTSPGVVTDLESYTIYEFQLICVNLAGSSEALDFPPQRTLAGKPSKPRNVRISEIEARRVFVQWDEPLVTNGPIDGYLLIARGGIKDLTHAPYVPGTSAEFTGLTPHTNYRIYARALNLNSEEGTQTSNESEPSESFETLQAAPGEPVGLTVDDTQTECIISWGQPSEPNGVITKYTLYEEVLRKDTNAVERATRMDLNANENQKAYIKAESYSIFRFSVTASTEPGEGDNATSTDTCETPQGVPMAPPSIPTPNEEAISQTSFTTTLLPYDARNGPVSCCEVIVVELQSGDADLDSSDPSYSPAQIMSYKEAQHTIGTPFRAVVFSNCPTDGATVVIGANTGNDSTCYTGGSAGSAGRRRRQTTGASTLTAVNGPLNTGGIYSTFVRVYTPSPEDPQMAFYESGPFMVPVTLKSSGTPVTLTIVSVTVIIVLICVIMIFICIRKRKRSRRQRNRSPPTASAGCTTTYCMCTDPLPTNDQTMDAMIMNR